MASGPPTRRVAARVPCFTPMSSRQSTFTRTRNSGAKAAPLAPRNPAPTCTPSSGTVLAKVRWSTARSLAHIARTLLSRSAKEQPYSLVAQQSSRCSRVEATKASHLPSFCWTPSVGRSAERARALNWLAGRQPGSPPGGLLCAISVSRCAILLYQSRGKCATFNPFVPSVISPFYDSILIYIHYSIFTNCI